MRAVLQTYRAGSRGFSARAFWLAFAVAWLLASVSSPSFALEPIPVDPNQDRIEITTLGELHVGRGDILQVETAPGADGVSGRMSVRAATSGTNPNWIVFALHNPTDKPIERWLTAERYTITGSSVIWPDLDAQRIEAVTPSLGYLPERVKSDRADIFRISLDAGQTITYVAELASDRPVRIQLWKPLEYELYARDKQLFNGIMLGITGLLAIFLTVVFAANHKAIFPAAALVAWCVLGYLCVDFGFWHKLLQLRPEDNAVYRAATESAIAASLLIFLGVFLRLKFWNTFVRMIFTVWIVAQLCLIAVAIIDPRLAATFARASFPVIGAVGAMLTLYLAARGQDRALSLIPAWILLLVWIFAAGVTLTGKLSGDIVVSGLVAGLVLIILLLGLTVTQFAFRSYEPLYGATPNDLQVRSHAIDGAGAAVWEWLARRDEIKVSPIIEDTLGLSHGELSAKVDDFAKHLHSADKERFRLLLWSVQERNGGNMHIELRMRHADNSYRWFELEAASLPSADRKALRCVGLMRDVTEAKRAQERLLHDAVHDSLTGLPNRELFLDRLGVAVARSKVEQHVRPAVIFIDIDKFKSVNSSLGLIVGDSLLLTIARRLTRHLSPQDTLARVSGDQFAILLIASQDGRELAMLAERVRRSLRSPIKIAGKEIVLTASTGIAMYDGALENPHDLLKEAEIAMYRAKRGGADRVEVFQPEMRNQADDRVTIESDLRRAIERRQLRIMYQPIIYLPTEELAGFEALVRWEHPKLGLLNPAEFVPVAEESDLIVKLGSYVLTRSAQEAARWHKELPRGDNALFVSVNVSSRQLFRQDLIQEIRQILGRAVLPPGALRLEITESLVMENPEQAGQVLEWLRGAGAGLSMDDFGAGYSSLAYLQRFPFDTIKIDRGLVQSSSDDGPGAAIVRSIIALAHELGKKVVAEGIEYAESASFLRALGCEYAQGFYYGEQMSDRDVMQLLRVIRKSERKLQRRGFFRTNVGTRKRRDKSNAETPEIVVDGADEAVLAADAASGIAPNGGTEGAATAAPGENGEAGKNDAAETSKRLPIRLFGRGARTRARTKGVNGAPGEAQSQRPEKAASAAKAIPPISASPLPLQPSGNGQAPADVDLPSMITSRRIRPGNPGVNGGPPPSVPKTERPNPTQPPPPLPVAARGPTGAPPLPKTGAPPAAAPGMMPPVNGAPPPQMVPRPSHATMPPTRGMPPAASAGMPMPNVAGNPPGRPAPTPRNGADGGRPAPMPPQSAPPHPRAASAGTMPPPTTGRPMPAAPAGSKVQPEMAAGGHGNGGSDVPPTRRPATQTAPPTYPSLPPAIAESLAKLAGVPITERPQTGAPRKAAPGPAPAAGDKTRR